ncbi:hypothetical protein CRU87_07595 [Aliarcobacter trophiarum LMG 25534]|uniref:DUF1924 domain-containing protein n=1 Tax=Aliarcobacter trophiarum LMG 25534 TaxID=1032241 RepID=A0AAD0VLB0_9BACT|nr:DUF1924 domain-containing protein [Aliarcobacter trophiarum]AXK48019.1 DUF1924 domain-containing protein [Aliarcobacter trophiarum LMG 25534]RXJ90036.1 hypothetical protein CRU87_07595 [Aliarcobacter trophiarum LMG 25534]
MKIVIVACLLASLGFSSVIDDFLSSLKQEAIKENPSFKEFDYKRGEELFLSKHIGKKGELISCASCHGTDLNKSNQNYFTGKTIDALSPKANQKRFTDKADIEKWLKRNFNDVYNREGTAIEKGDVVTYIINK